MRRQLGIRTKEKEPYDSFPFVEVPKNSSHNSLKKGTMTEWETLSTENYYMTASLLFNCKENLVLKKTFVKGKSL